MAKSRADSILRVARTPRAFLDAARKAGAELVGFEIGVNEAIPRTDVEPFFAALKATTPGHVVPGSYVIKGQGVWTAVLDSITPAGIPSWEQARTEAITQYRREAGSRALESKRAELDSMFAAGVPLDSLAAYWGGLQRVTDLTVGHPLPYTGNSEQIDSLLFGGRNSEPGLPAGGESGWVRGSGGFARLRIVSRSAPSASQLADRAEQLRRMAVEQKLSGYFDDLKSRYPVVILDRQLRDVSLLTGPQPPPAP